MFARVAWTLACIAAALAMVAVAEPVSAQRRITSPQWQFIQAIRSGDIKKARDLKELAQINVNDFDGRPFVAWLFEVDGQFNGMSDAAFEYVFRELKQDFNTPVGSNKWTTVVSMFCVNMAAQGHRQTDPTAGLARTLKRIQFAFQNGANPAPVPNVAWGLRDDQPLPRCVDAYVSLRSNPQHGAMVLEAIKLMLARKADPNYDYTIVRATKIYDVALLSVLHGGGARLVNAIPVTGDADVCKGHNLPPNNVLAALPSPSDQDVAVARPFLVELAKRGVDLKSQQNFVRFSAAQCHRSTTTLLQRAINLAGC